MKSLKPSIVTDRLSTIHESAIKHCMDDMYTENGNIIPKNTPIYTSKEVADIFMKANHIRSYSFPVYLYLTATSPDGWVIAK